VTAEEYQVGHSSHPKEMQQMASFVDKVIFGDENEETSTPNKRDDL
jgi:hypothetical protein